VSRTVLCIDIASPAFALALSADGEVTESFQQDSNQDHSRLLLPAIARLLGVGRKNLSGVVVVVGPGSYAGLRVGIATAEGLSLALGIPLAGVGTLEAVAAASAADDCVAIHPAGRGEWAVQRFQHGVAAGEMRALTRDQVEGPLFGEGAGELGGTEITPAVRCAHALRLGLPRLAEAAGAVDAIYLREPHITRPRREGRRVTRG